MTRPNEQYAYFTVTGDFDPGSISKALRIEPTESWQKGDRNETTHYERKFSRWSLRSRLDDFVSLEPHIRDVLDQLKERAAEVRAVANDHNYAGIQCVGHFYASYPGLSLDRSLIRDMAALNLDIDFDFYYMYSDRRDDS
jgi:hypothetical protein